MYNDKEFIYERNIQGDIVSIYDSEVNKVASYNYDAYGNCVIVDNIATINPFRYRGYYYDEETKLYYLNSRYYDPETGRFISPDTLSILDETRGQINGLNLYMYCRDNPIMRVDSSGMAWWEFWKWNWGRIANVSIAILTVGALALASIFTAGTTLGVVLTGVAIGGAISAGSQFVSNGSVNFGQLLLDISVGAVVRL